MAYFLGAVYPFLMLIGGALILLVGLVEQRDGSAIAGAILLTGVLLHFRPVDTKSVQS